MPPASCRAGTLTGRHLFERLLGRWPNHHATPPASLPLAALPALSWGNEVRKMRAVIHTTLAIGLILAPTAAFAQGTGATGGMAGPGGAGASGSGNMGSSTTGGPGTNLAPGGQQPTPGMTNGSSSGAMTGSGSGAGMGGGAMSGSGTGMSGSGTGMGSGGAGTGGMGGAAGGRRRGCWWRRRGWRRQIGCRLTGLSINEEPGLLRLGSQRSVGTVWDTPSLTFHDHHIHFNPKRLPRFVADHALAQSFHEGLVGSIAG